jgi:calcium/proton exchanger (cax)
LKIVKPVLYWLLIVTIPMAIYLELTHGGDVPLFIFSALAVLPIAAWIGKSTEHLAARMGSTYGALFNATFGNLAEMVIAFFAIRAGLLGIVKASFTGSIIGNLLFVGGLSMLVGGWKREKQTFNTLLAESQSGLLMIATASLIIPTLFFSVGGGRQNVHLMHEVSVGTAIILLLTYAAGLWFTFRTHSDALAPASEESGHGDQAQWSVSKALLVLLGSSVLMGVVAEGLVGAVDAVGRAWGLNEVFLGFVVVAVIGNAAEHSTAVMLAYRNQMDTSLNIALQSSVQIALFVTPLLVLLSFPLGHPLDLVFTPFEVIAVGLAVLILSYLSVNGESNWLEGFQLLALYAMIAVAIFFMKA